MIISTLLSFKLKCLFYSFISFTFRGDDGNECDIMSALPGLIYYGNSGYGSVDDENYQQLAQGFGGICGGNLEDWVSREILCFS